MPSSANEATARALAAALTSPVGRGMLDGGFSTFAPEVEALDERIRLSVRSRTSHLPALRSVLTALRRREAADSDRLHVLTGARLRGWDVGLLVSYCQRWGALEVAEEEPDVARTGELRAAGIDLVGHARPADVTDPAAADELIDRFLHDLATLPSDGARPPSGPVTR